MTDASTVLTRFVDRMIERVLDEPKVRVFWLESAKSEALRRPYSGVELHLAVEDPDFEMLCEQHGDWLANAGDLTGHQDESADFEGVRCQALLGTGEAVDVWLERMSLVGKRCRVQVLPLVDRTGQFRQVLDLSRS